MKNLFDYLEAGEPLEQFLVDFPAVAPATADEGCLNVLDVDSNDGEVLRRYVRLTNFTPCNPTKEGLFTTTMERIVADRNRRRR